MRKKLLIGGGALLVMIVIMLVTVTDGLAEGARVQLNGIDLADVADGDYTGVYDFKRWSNTVVVHVEGHEITSIELAQDVPAAAITDCADEVFARVIAAQDTAVDAVSGATVTSKAYLKAIEDAVG
jgi:uncharacterized protein with FMN-binding domain